MEQYIELVSVPVIVAIVYWVMNLIKYTTNNNEKVLRFVPLMAVACGAICGVIAFYAVPGTVVADNVFVALVIGGASGLSATGTNQIIKQLTSNKKEDKTDDKE